MSKVVILKIDTLSHVFTTLESGSKCQFQYELINNDKISNVIQPLVVNDAVLCVFDDVIKIALRVVGKTFNKVTLTKEIELNEGFQITDENILRVLNDTQIYECNVDFKQNLYESLTGNFKSTLRQLFEIDVTEEKEINNGNAHTKQQSAMNFTPSQIIYYGVPGCGKSHEIKKKLKNVPDYNKIRTVFHPEYCNADFVGQILPEVNINADGRSIVEYKFKPGPFTEIVRRAYLNPDENFYLVIEEINRGNAAAIFGEMFQLLDRLDADEKADEVSSEHIYGKGWSSYGVDNQDVNAYIRNQVVISQEKPDHCSKVTGSAGDLNPRLYKSINIESENVTVTWREKNENGFTPKSKHIHFTANTAIRLPPNLSIYATMNTSDQNVFTLDNAFQRRWEMKQIPNDLKNTGDSAAQYHRTIKKVKKTESREETIDTNVQWGDFRKAINEVIMDSAQANGLSSMEDKRLGGWFYTESDNFAEKVLKYLWDDAFKFDRPNQFNGVTTLEELVEKFNGDDGFKVFKDGRISELQKDSSTTPDGSAQNDNANLNG